MKKKSTDRHVDETADSADATDSRLDGYSAALESTGNEMRKFGDDRQTSKSCSWLTGEKASTCKGKPA